MSATDALIKTLQAWSARWPDDRAVTLVRFEDDADTGAALTRAGIEATTTNARPAYAVEQLGAASSDYALVGPELHRLPEIERLTALRAAERLARQGVLWIGQTDRAAGLTRAWVLRTRARLSMSYLHRVRLPRFSEGPFLLAGEFADAWTGLGDTRNA
ncbi:MAG: hypothetical protein AAGH64_02325 [Planctomycetota bacterium]